MHKTYYIKILYHFNSHYITEFADTLLHYNRHIPLQNYSSLSIITDFL